MRRRHITAAAAAALALAAAGCGGGSGNSQGTTRQPRTASLDIVLRPGLIANAHTIRYHLTCGPVAGSVPHPAAACAALARRPQLLEPLPKCRKLLPDTGSRTVTGTFDGRHVALSFSCPRGGLRWAQLSRALGITNSTFGTAGG